MIITYRTKYNSCPVTIAIMDAPTEDHSELLYYIQREIQLHRWRTEDNVRVNYNSYTDLEDASLLMIYDR